MNGKDLLKGMSNVNERYVQEAEIQFLQKKARIRWMSGLALAACIALLISGSIINGVFHARLSETEILALREKYPIYEYWRSEALIGSFRRVFVEEKVRGGSIQDFVYVEATGEAETYYKHRTINNKITKNKEETNTNWWDEYFSYERWADVFRRAGVAPSFYANRAFGDGEILPWSMIDCGVSEAYLRRERDRAYRNETTPSCAEHCNGCGANHLGGKTQWCK